MCGMRRLQGELGTCRKNPMYMNSTGLMPEDSSQCSARIFLQVIVCPDLTLLIFLGQSSISVPKAFLMLLAYSGLLLPQPATECQAVLPLHIVAHSHSQPCEEQRAASPGFCCHHRWQHSEVAGPALNKLCWWEGSGMSRLGSPGRQVPMLSSLPIAGLL